MTTHRSRTVKKPALGKGLDAILGPRLARDSQPLQQSDGNSVSQAPPSLYVDIEKVTAGRGQPRRIFRDEALDELAASIKEKGILQPLVVTKTSSGYELIAGERRLRAAARAGLDHVPVIVKSHVEPAELLELALIENIQRENLTPLELARAYQKLIDQHHYTQDEVAKRVGKSRTSIANTVRLLGLPDPVREALEQGLISEGHARAVLALPTAASQISACRTVVRNGLSVRETEELVKTESNQEAGSERQPPKRAQGEDPELSALESSLSRALGTRVRVRGNGERGRVEIQFFSKPELAGILDRLGLRSQRGF
jgi:ParB family chromosome partitioning protein